MPYPPYDQRWVQRLEVETGSDVSFLSTSTAASRLPMRTGFASPHSQGEVRYIVGFSFGMAHRRIAVPALNSETRERLRSVNQPPISKNAIDMPA